MENQVSPKVPRVLAIHDMSCLGRCSLTVVLPIMAACGIQAVPLPTALFSNHLAFPYETHYDFTDHMVPFMNMWDQNGVDFQGIYSGFLASPRQIDIVEEAIRRYADPGSFVVVDPAMADGGRMYAVYTEDMVRHMRHLVKHAVMIKPNYTEACFLTGTAYHPEYAMTEAELMNFLHQLSEGPEEIVMTSVPAGQGELMNVWYDKKQNRMGKIQFPLLPMETCGTGDMFSSVLTACRMQGINLETAVKEATAFMERVIRDTLRAGTRREQGVLFEPRLPELMKFLKVGKNME